MIELRRHIRDIPDFPKPGIVFRDITPLLADRDAFRALVDRFVERYRGRADVVLGIESRGFLIGAAVAYGLGTGGTASAAVELVKRCGGEVLACAFVIELAYLGGRRRLRGIEVFSLVDYEHP